MFDLRLENSSGNVVNINDGGRYQVLNISGLTPPVASVFASKSPNRKGRKKHGSTLDYRAIVIQIKLLGDIEANRNALYAWTDTETELKIYYSNSTKNVYCEGTVTECDIDLFTDNEVVNLAIECDDPYLQDIQEISTDVSSLLRQFTFPFAIDAEGVPFSTMRENNATLVYNAGAETGVKITVKCKNTLSNLRIYDARDTTRRIQINYNFEAGTLVEIDTENSPKTIKAFKPDGSVVNLLKYVSGNPTWFTLKKGANAFGYTADIGVDKAEISIGFRNRYLGV